MLTKIAMVASMMEARDELEKLRRTVVSELVLAGKRHSQRKRPQDIQSPTN